MGVVDFLNYKSEMVVIVFLCELNLSQIVHKSLTAGASFNENNRV